MNTLWDLLFQTLNSVLDNRLAGFEDILKSVLGTGAMSMQLFNEQGRLGPYSSMIDKRSGELAKDVASNVLNANLRNVAGIFYRSVNPQGNMSRVEYDKMIGGKVDELMGEDWRAYLLREAATMTNFARMGDLYSSMVTTTSNLAKAGQRIGDRRYISHARTIASNLMTGEYDKETDTYGKMAFDSDKWGGFDRSGVATIASYMSESASFLQGLGDGDVANLNRAVQRFRNTVKDMADALSPLQDVFGQDVKSMVQTLERATGQNFSSMTRNTVSSLSSELSLRAVTGQLAEGGKEGLPMFQTAMGKMLSNTTGLPVYTYLSGTGMALNAMDMLGPKAGGAPGYLTAAQWHGYTTRTAFESGASGSVPMFAKAYALWKHGEGKGGTMEEFSRKVLESGDDMIAKAMELAGVSSIFDLNRGLKYSEVGEVIQTGEAARLSSAGLLRRKISTAVYQLGKDDSMYEVLGVNKSRPAEMSRRLTRLFDNYRDNPALTKMSNQEILRELLVKNKVRLGSVRLGNVDLKVLAEDFRDSTSYLGKAARTEAIPVLRGRGLTVGARNLDDLKPEELSSLQFDLGKEGDRRTLIAIRDELSRQGYVKLGKKVSEMTNAEFAAAQLSPGMEATDLARLSRDADAMVWIRQQGGAANEAVSAVVAYGNANRSMTRIRRLKGIRDRSQRAVGLVQDMEKLYSKKGLDLDAAEAKQRKIDDMNQLIAADPEILGPAIDVMIGLTEEDIQGKTGEQLAETRRDKLDKLMKKRDKQLRNLVGYVASGNISDEFIKAADTYRELSGRRLKLQAAEGGRKLSRTERADIESRLKILEKASPLTSAEEAAMQQQLDRLNRPALKGAEDLFVRTQLKYLNAGKIMSEEELVQAKDRLAVLKTEDNDTEEKMLSRLNMLTRGGKLTTKESKALMHINNSALTGKGISAADFKLAQDSTEVLKASGLMTPGDIKTLDTWLAAEKDGNISLIQASSVPVRRMIRSKIKLSDEIKELSGDDITKMIPRLQNKINAVRFVQKSSRKDISTAILLEGARIRADEILRNQGEDELSSTMDKMKVSLGYDPTVMNGVERARLKSRIGIAEILVGKTDGELDDIISKNADTLDKDRTAIPALRLASDKRLYLEDQLYTARLLRNTPIEHRPALISSARNRLKANAAVDFSAMSAERREELKAHYKAALNMSKSMRLMDSTTIDELKTKLRLRLEADDHSLDDSKAAVQAEIKRVSTDSSMSDDDKKTKLSQLRGRLQQLENMGKLSEPDIAALNQASWVMLVTGATGNRLRPAAMTRFMHEKLYDSKGAEISDSVELMHARTEVLKEIYQQYTKNSSVDVTGLLRMDYISNQVRGHIGGKKGGADSQLVAIHNEISRRIDEERSNNNPGLDISSYLKDQLKEMKREVASDKGKDGEGKPKYSKDMIELYEKIVTSANQIQSGTMSPIGAVIGILEQIRDRMPVTPDSSQSTNQK